MGENEQALLESAAEQDAAQQDSQQDEEQQPEETVDKSNSGEAQQSPMSMLRLICINMHALGYGLFYASVGVLASVPPLVLAPRRPARRWEHGAVCTAFTWCHT
jgi:hypothetical protein